mgnify:CR=1 FL=1
MPSTDRSIAARFPWAAGLLLGSAMGIPASAATPFEQEYREHVDYLRAHVPDGFTVVEVPPWVVVGDGDPAAVRHHAEHTVAWAHVKLRARHFPRDPGIVDVWLFADESSYVANVRSMLGEVPTTPYGFANERGLFMNISTGGGTLVHEMVHPFLRANFPDCPPWLNEGLASLYEQSAERDGTIVGLTNWRLEGLQLAIVAKTVPDFRAFMAQSRHAFYQQDPGTNYAQGRYLLFYLQQKGLLDTYYKRLRANIRADPTGFDTLVELLDGEDPADFQERWEAYVLLLKFPES